MGANVILGALLLVGRELILMSKIYFSKHINDYTRLLFRHTLEFRNVVINILFSYC